MVGQKLQREEKNATVEKYLNSLEIPEVIMCLEFLIVEKSHMVKNQLKKYCMMMNPLLENPIENLKVNQPRNLEKNQPRSLNHY